MVVLKILFRLDMGLIYPLFSVQLMTFRTEVSLQISFNIFGFLFFQIRARILMELATAADQNVMLAGPPGSGKTFLINDFLHLHGKISWLFGRRLLK